MNGDRGVLNRYLKRPVAAACESLPWRSRWTRSRLMGVLDLFEEHLYVGEITPDGRYVHHATDASIAALFGGAVPEGVDLGALWESRIPASDREAYLEFNRRLLAGHDADVTYQVQGLDGTLRRYRDRGRPRVKATGGVWVDGIISDVTAREEAAAELAEVNRRFTSLLDVVGAHVYLMLARADHGLEELFQGPGGDRLLGGAEPDPDMVNWDAAVYPEDRAAYDAFNQGLAEGRDGEVFYRLIGADGVTRWVHDRGTCRPIGNGEFEVSGIVSDVTDRRRLEEELRRSVEEMRKTHRDLEQARAEAEQRAATDDLTGAYNRRHFLQIASSRLESAAPTCGLLLLDADHFKQINDRHGHVVGDAVLMELARRLQSALDPNDCLARWGGEEFAVLLDDCASEDELTERAEQIRLSVCRSPIVDAPEPIELTISIGAALGGAHDVIDILLDHADRCLYAAKRQGRNRTSLRPGSAPALTAGDTHDPALELAQTLVSIASLHGGISEEHAEQVAAIASLTATYLGLSPTLVARCRLGGLLHDIGKVAVSEESLTKAAPLSEVEWAEMRTHPAVGAAIALRIDALAAIAPAIRHHHERYDGRGYPDHLVGTQIPLEARIIAAADSYAAMTAPRAYKTARTAHEAAVELRLHAGSQLDPVIVDALLAALDTDAVGDLAA